MEVLKFRHRKGVQEIYPVNRLVKDWVFSEDEEAEAALAHHMAVVAEKNGITATEMMHLFPCVLRMLKSNIQWSK